MSNPNNAHEPAMPISEESAEHLDMAYIGLTKREHFAGLALQGLLAHEGKDLFTTVDTLTRTAVLYADTLLEELDK